MPARPTDLLDLDSLLSEDERAVRDSVRRFVEARVQPVIAEHWRRGTFPDELVEQLASLGLLGASLHGYGCAGMGPMAYGLALMELERADSGVRSFVSVQSSLVMFPIWRYGTDEQKQRLLPELAAGRKVGCFALTEPDAGSDPAAMRTRARKDGDGYVLSGTKRWITNGTRADVCVVWAKTGDDAASIRGFLVEKGTPGFTQAPIERKQSFRASDTAELHFDDVRLGADALLPGTGGLGSALACLFEARAGIACGVLGAAQACLETAVDFAKSRVAFGRPIAGMQLVQGKLAHMASELAKAQLVAWRVMRLKEQGALLPVQVSVAKMNNVKTALEIARTCRDVLGANGITDEYPVMRHMCNLETVFTYEGTHDVHALVVGAFVTGVPAFRG